MSCRILLAPAAAGKTAWVVAEVRAAAQGLQRTPFVVVPTPLQAQSLRTRLAHAGGALGVQVLTFDDLYLRVLQVRGCAFTELATPVRQRLLRVTVDELVAEGKLAFYQALAARPGFITVLDDFVAELKGARIEPAALRAGLDALGRPPRLVELAAIYDRYQGHLLARGWADRAGVAWLALEQLERPDFAWPASQSPLFFDGFDSFTKVQLAALAGLAHKAPATAVTLTWPEHPAARQLFAETAAALEAALMVKAEQMVTSGTAAAPEMAALLRSIFVPAAAPMPAGDAVHLVAATNRNAEVRAALRWLKRRIVHDGCRLDEVALLARSMRPYREIIVQTAEEFGIPVRLADGLPLRTNPAIVALLNLLRLMLPDARTGDAALPRRAVVEAWRSPYFDLGGDPAAASGAPGLTDGDAEQLDAAARQGRVVRGLEQWREALAALAGTGPPIAEEEVPAQAPMGDAALTLRDKFERFVQLLTPPAGVFTLRTFAGWLEELIGDSPPAGEPGAAPAHHLEARHTLNMVARIAEGDEADHLRDIAALRGLKEVLRGLVWAERALADAGKSTAVDFSRFVAELSGAVDAASYHQPPAHDGALLVATTVEARGVPFRAVAVLGLAEGELPARLAEDPFLRDDDRRRLRAQGVPLEQSTRSNEREYFYMTLGRASTHLLLTRPRLADNGADWEPSPYWDDVRRLTAAEPVNVRGGRPATVQEAASTAELLAAIPGFSNAAVYSWLQAHEGERLLQLAQAAAVLQARSRRRSGPASPFDGDLAGQPLTQDAGVVPLLRWSASRLERYRTCPYWFYLTHVLGIEARLEPEEGADIAQLGSIYHRLLEQVYRQATDTTDLSALLAVLPDVARRVLDDAPAADGFRVNAWWAQTRLEIEANVRRSLEALAAMEGEPIHFEAGFGGEQSLVLARGDETFTLRGKVDRIDRLPGGGLRVVDYKTGVGNYDRADALAEGRRLQLPLYALAAQEALQLGPVVDGIYWFVHKARASAWSLAGYDGGAEGAMQQAVDFAWGAVDGARAGNFAPHPPDEGCPEYCAAAAFCWHYRPK